MKYVEGSKSGFVVDVSERAERVCADPGLVGLPNPGPSPSLVARHIVIRI